MVCDGGHLSVMLVPVFTARKESSAVRHRCFVIELSILCPFYRTSSRLRMILRFTHR